MAGLRLIDLASFQHRRVELPSSLAKPFVVGRAPDADLTVPSEQVARAHCLLRGDQVEVLAPDGELRVNHRPVRTARLRHGDVVDLHEALLVYLDRPEQESPVLLAALDDEPDDAVRATVWSDWLQEHGDPLGLELARGPTLAALEGLGAAVADGRLELDWSHGLIAGARLRCISDATWRELEVLGRLLSLRVARWVRRLELDLSSWVLPTSARVEAAHAAVLRGLLGGPGLPRLEALSFGYREPGHAPSHFLEALRARLPARFPRLGASAGQIAPAHRAWLEVERAPAAVLVEAPHWPAAQRFPLDTGLWVGSTARALRVVPPGVERPGLATCFVVRQAPPRWCLLPVEPGLRLNGQPAVPCRLLPGDLLEDARGVRYRFTLEG